jgi:hypothetical protein
MTVANYYTTRFNPAEWPPESGEIPAGVTVTLDDLAVDGHLCCAGAALESVQTSPLEERWAYRVTYRLACPEHGTTEIELFRRLDWISPNEYLL